MTYPFTLSDLLHAQNTWGCNCGPAALAFALQRRLDVARRAIPDFETRRYTSPTMMKKALAAIGVTHESLDRHHPAILRDMFDAAPALVRIQWTGPWTEPGANPWWAYRKTHWIATWLAGDQLHVFDCNSGIVDFARWKREVVPHLTALYPKADGGFFPTHVWRITHVPQEVVA